jgi:hypothetical protein
MGRDDRALCRRTGASRGCQDGVREDDASTVDSGGRRWLHVEQLRAPLSVHYLLGAAALAHVRELHGNLGKWSEWEPVTQAWAEAMILGDDVFAERLAIAVEGWEGFPEVMAFLAAVRHAITPDE